MKTAFEVVAEDDPNATRWGVSTLGWSTGKTKWFDTEEEAHAHAEKQSRRKISDHNGGHYSYPYYAMPFGPNVERVWPPERIYHKGEVVPYEQFDNRGNRIDGEHNKV